MREAIAVLNAGSSSLKFSPFELAQGELALVARGQAEGLATRHGFPSRAIAALDELRAGATRNALR